MTQLDTAQGNKRREFRNINAFSDLPRYRLPLAGVVSILHRISGAILFLLLPFIIWMFDVSVSSEISFARFKNVFTQGLGQAGSGLPGWFMKLVVLVLIWSYLHHLIAGLRHLWMDINLAVSKEFGRRSAALTLVSSLGFTLIFAAKLFGMY